MLCVFSFFTASAQDDREDVVYLKNGNIYRGVIIEQVPGQTLKVETLGGNVFTVQISDITKITKERKVMPDNVMAPQGQRQDLPPMHGPDDRRPDMGGRGRGPHDFHSYRYYRYDSTGGKRVREFHYRKKGYFFEAQLVGEANQGGIRIINGYKFSQFGYLGIGVGIDVLGSMHMGWTDNSSASDYPYAGVYMPLFLHYSGDILRKRVTPFYSLDMGYAMRSNGGSPFMGRNSGDRQGGAMGGLGFGVKFWSKRRVNISLSVNADFQNVRYVPGYNSFGNPDMTWQYGRTLTIMTPGLKFGIGF